MKILGIILGILLVIGGIWCAMTPLATFSVLGVFLGIAMLVAGIDNIITWSARKRAGLADGWSLAGAICSAALGVAILCSGFLQIALDALLAYIAAFWLIFEGVIRIMGALQLKKNANRISVFSHDWIFMLIVGILVVILGVICLFHPVFTMVNIGLLMGIGIAVDGVSLVVASIVAE